MSIFEFAAKLAGVSQEQVRVTLNLEKRFEDKPILKNMLENGEASINKLARIVSIATPENQEKLAEQIKILPRRALDTLVRDVAIENKNGLQMPFFMGKGLSGQTFQLADDVQTELDELHSKGIDMNELLREMLKKRRAEIAAKKEKIAENIQPATSRYIPVRIKEILKKEYGEKCSIATCQKPAAETHHVQRFSLSQNHDPRFLAPLCREHHIIAHSIDVKFHEARMAAIT